MGHGDFKWIGITHRLNAQTIVQWPNGNPDPGFLRHVRLKSPHQRLDPVSQGYFAGVSKIQHLNVSLIANPPTVIVYAFKYEHVTGFSSPDQSWQ